MDLGYGMTEQRLFWTSDGPVTGWRVRVTGAEQQITCMYRTEVEQSKMCGHEL